MLSVHRLLILDRDLETRSGIPLVLEHRGGNVLADSVTTISDALDRLATTGYEAVLCRVDEPEDTSSLMRIKHRAPLVSIIAVTPKNSSALEELARDTGADDVRSRGIPSPERGHTVRRAIGVHELIERTRAVLDRRIDLEREHKRLLALTRRNLARSRHLTNPIDLTDPLFQSYVPLMVDDDPKELHHWRRAFEAASSPFQLNIARDGREAIRYLSGEGTFADRSLFPFPTLVILDLGLLKKSGFEVLEWIRSCSQTAQLAVFVTGRLEELDRALSQGANGFYVKPAGIPAMLDMAKAMMGRWLLLRRAHEARGRRF